ncbi:ROK family protein [Deinococcus yavapaiensis]|uniref:Glucokinase n=1 Tax=Deinococcus yavapaiensis KR-236 TaxID=694435 RepID=A0A318S677_9DEIO|nr:ROK family protein [Deinococcus yavapaiensis]PYE51914.1 glucokinase [Deinococcus yavapaiensis KR-236]
MTAEGSDPRSIVGAIDWGGTKLLVGLVDDEGRVLASRAVPTPTGGASNVLSRAVELLRESLAEQDRSGDALRGVGVTVPGVVDAAGHVLKYAPAHGLRDVPVARELGMHVGVPVRIANDVDACALAEVRFGRANFENFAWVTISTGVGGAFVLDRRLFRGGGLAGEIGHVVVEEGGPRCGCGHLGCLEAVAAGPAIALHARSLGLPARSAQDVAALAASGNLIARSALERAAAALGRALAFVQNLLDLDAVVLGGGVARSLNFDVIRATLADRVLPVPGRHLPVLRLTALEAHAALLGAASLVLPPENH